MPDATGERGYDPLKALAQLLEDAHGAAPTELPRAVHRAAGTMGASHVEILLVDWQQDSLVQLLMDESGADRIPVPIEGTVAGRAFTSGTVVVTAAAEGGVVINTPLLDGIERLGVLQLRMTQGGDRVQGHCRRFADLVTQFVATKGRFTDEYHIARQSRPMSLAAQMQWQVLPPMTAHAPTATIAGQIEPAYEVGGDVFDYAVNRERVHLGIFDAMGHGVSASVVTALAVAAYRNSRRRGHDLVRTLDYIDAELTAEFPDDRYVTALLGELDLTNGHVTFVNAGHLQPLLLRDRRITDLRTVEPTWPLGLGLPGRPPIVLTETRLQARDRLLLVTDGVVDARDACGVSFGERRLADLTERAALQQLPLMELVRSISRGVFDYQQGTLRDDASLLMVEYVGQPGQKPPAGEAPPE